MASLARAARFDQLLRARSDDKLSVDLTSSELWWKITKFCQWLAACPVKLLHEQLAMAALNCGTNYALIASGRRKERER